MAAVALALATSAVAQPQDPDEARAREQKRVVAAEQEPHRTATVQVTAALGTAADAPDALATTVIHADDALAEPGDFQDLVTRVPGVGATGQNGIFETFSIRGSGANNIQILFAGMPLTAQRRAGVPVSFLEPALLGDITVTRGPAVVHYGPGALGGAVSVEPRWFDAPYLAGGYATGGDDFVAVAGIGNESFSFGAARHGADDTRAPNGTPLHTMFDRASAVMQYQSRIGTFALDAMLALSATEDIGKSNSRFPARDTIYPHDDHSLARIRLRGDNGFAVSVQGHDQELRTRNRRPGSDDTFADVQSRDVGATVQQTVEAGAFTHNVGVEYLGRRDVDAFDARGSIANRRYTLRGAREDNASLFAITDLDLSESVRVELGARHSFIEQKQGGAEIDDDDTGFTAGAVWSPDDSQRWSANLARGYRFASLEERYFSGVTAQGEVAGNPDLGSERALGIDVGHAWTGERVRTEVHLWRNDVDDLIQLTSVAPGVNGFTNVGDAKLQGIDASVEWRATQDLALRAIATIVDSEDESTGEPLFGTPPKAVELEAKYRFGDFSLGARYQHRWRVADPGFEEVERDAVDVLDAELGWHATPALSLKLYVQNLFDEDYFATSDALSAFAPERSFGIKAVWMPD